MNITKVLSVVCIAAFLCFSESPHAQHKMRSPHSFQKKTIQEHGGLPSPLSLYKRYISKIDGDRCPMYPSCSEYAKEAFLRYGPLVGLVKTADRLIRCGYNLDRYPTIWLNGRYKFIDPLDDHFRRLGNDR